jgi:putrescine transport system substrate-binding protein
MALAHMGMEPDSTNKADYAKVEEMLKKVRPYIKTFDNYAYQRMPQKEFCVAVTWGPDGLLAMSGAEEANTGVVLDFFLPEHPNFWVDAWVIPADAKNLENAYLFLNYMMRPQVGANDSNYTWYATANKDSIPMIDEAVTSSTAAFPTPAQVAGMYTLKPLPSKIERVRTRTWTNFKAAN